MRFSLWYIKWTTYSVALLWTFMDDQAFASLTRIRSLLINISTTMLPHVYTITDAMSSTITCLLLTTVRWTSLASTVGISSSLQVLSYTWRPLYPLTYLHYVVKSSNTTLLILTIQWTSHRILVFVYTLTNVWDIPKIPLKLCFLSHIQMWSHLKLRVCYSQQL